MKHLLKIVMLFWISFNWAQPKLEMTPKGFAPLEIEMPNQPVSELIKMSRDWAYDYNPNGYDIFDVTENSFSIQALRENAYYNWNLAVKYNYDIKYILKIVFKENHKYTLTFIVKDIYTDDVPLKSTIADFFTSSGELKESYKDVKPSLENTVNKIVKSYINYIAQ